MSVNLAEAKTQLSALVDRAAAGEEIIIAKSGKPLARLMPLAERPRRQIGIAKHWLEVCPEMGDPDFFKTDDADIEAAWDDGKDWLAPVDRRD